MQVLRSFVCAPLVLVISVVLLHHNALGCYKPSPNGRLNKLGCPLSIHIIPTIHELHLLLSYMYFSNHHKPFY